MISFIQPIYASSQLESTNHSALEKPHLYSLSAYLNKFLHTLYASICRYESSSSSLWKPIKSNPLTITDMSCYHSNWCDPARFLLFFWSCYTTILSIWQGAGEKYLYELLRQAADKTNRKLYDGQSNANILVIAAAPASLAALIVIISIKPGTPSPAIFDTILSIINLLLHYIWTGDPGSQSAVKWRMKYSRAVDSMVTKWSSKFISRQ